MKRITAWAAVLTLTLSLLTGCAQIDESSADELPFPSEETPVEEEHSGLPAVFALPYLEGQPLNPLTCPDGVQQTVASLLYEGLFRLDQTFTPQPLLCASYTYDSETLTYKLTLRDGVVFSDGSPLTAADVKSHPQRRPQLRPLRQTAVGCQKHFRRGRYGDPDPQPPQYRSARSAGHSHSEVRHREAQRPSGNRSLPL